MIARTKKLVLVLCAAFVLGGSGLAWFGYSYLCPYSPRNRAAAVHATLTWGRLAPFPPSAQQLVISTTGNMFTRGFRISFVAPVADVEQWLWQSPGTREASSETLSSGVRRFEIAPGGGAQHAEVIVDDIQHRVSIRVYWS